MDFAKIVVHGTCIEVIYAKNIPAGIVGATISVEFCGDVWSSLNKTIVFGGSDATRDVLNPGDVVTIPHEVVQQPGGRLKVGVYGTDTTGATILPTFSADLGWIRESTDPSGDPSADPMLPVWAQLQAEVEQLKQQGGGGPGGGGLTELPIATDKTLGGVIVGSNLTVTPNGTISVDTTGEVLESDQRPITSQAVHEQFETIVALLKNI